ncbi:hypothetical protein BCR34DRAFT_488645 [Clohesyomyces aquaticus]|uniref:Uncharacterized protein n=1 Tax=Clohesyomyces aquaticus TaxID=1231657 RepID=A0A1Y1ZDZ7_9PLEO|nr:hypothetical protein BCR34DRAFT_488645 [Clohesyomyces aquaticus]
MGAPNLNTTTTTVIPPFTLSSPAGTDIWRKPPTTNVFTAPLHPSAPPTIPLKSFVSARLSFVLPPTSQLRQYDQAGLLLRFTKPGLDPSKSKWIKTGIEFYYGKPYVSTVGCDTWADWSIVPSEVDAEGRPGATIEARREEDGLGKSLWVYWVTKGEDGKEELRPVRELTWVFAEEEGWEVGVAGLVARPTTEGGEGELRAEFGGIEVVALKE